MERLIKILLRIHLGSGYLLVLGGSASQVLAMKVAKELGVGLCEIETKKFPDGEKYVRILNDVKGEDVAVIQSTYHRPDEYLIEYFLLVDALRDLSVGKVSGIFPYFAYARQDERFNPGEATSFLTVSRMIEKVGTDEVYTIDSHRHRIPVLSTVFNIPAHELTAMSYLTRYIRQNFQLSRPLVIGPDEESEQWAKTAAEELGSDYDILEKKRLGPDSVQIQPKSMDVRGRDVVLVDDIISTGGTVVEAIRVLRQLGALNIFVASTHPVLVENALAKIYKAGARAVVGTDTIPSPISLVSVAPIIADALRKASRVTA